MSETHPGDDLVALALDDLHPRARAAAVEHLLACPRCREEYDALAATVESTLVAAPAVGPPPGFEKRVLAALGVDAASGTGKLGEPTRAPAATPVRASAGKHAAAHSHRRRGPLRGQWLLVAASAVIGLALGSGATLALQDDSAPSASGPSSRPEPAAPSAEPPGTDLSKPDGTVVGAVTTSTLGPQRVYVVIVSSGPPGMRYLCRLRLEDGSIVQAAHVRLDSESGVWIVPARPEAVELELVALNGRGPLWSTATL